MKYNSITVSKISAPEVDLLCVGHVDGSVRFPTGTLPQIAAIRQIDVEVATKIIISLVDLKL